MTNAPPGGGGFSGSSIQTSLLELFFGWVEVDLRSHTLNVNTQGAEAGGSL